MHPKKGSKIHAETKKTAIFKKAPKYCYFLKEMSTLYKRYRIAALGSISARVAGEIWASRKGFQEYFEQDGEVGLRNKYKYDILLLGMAKTNKVDMIIFTRRRLEKFSKS